MKTLLLITLVALMAVTVQAQKPRTILEQASDSSEIIEYPVQNIDTSVIVLKIQPHFELSYSNNVGETVYTIDSNGMIHFNKLGLYKITSDTIILLKEYK